MRATIDVNCKMMTLRKCHCTSSYSMEFPFSGLSVDRAFLYSTASMSMCFPFLLFFVFWKSTLFVKFTRRRDGVCEIYKHWITTSWNAVHLHKMPYVILDATEIRFIFLSCKNHATECSSTQFQFARYVCEYACVFQIVSFISMYKFRTKSKK